MVELRRMGASSARISEIVRAIFILTAVARSKAVAPSPRAALPCCDSTAPRSTRARAPHHNHQIMTLRALSLAALVAAAACSGSKAPEPAAAPGAADQIPIGQLPDIDGDAVLAHTKKLSSDEFEGRGPGTKGEELTVKYLVDEFTKIGLKPGNTDGTYIQKVPLVGITPTPAPLVLKKGARQQPLKWRDDVVAWTKHVADSASLENSELVFVGYGVVAPEYNWDDYKGV